MGLFDFLKKKPVQQHVVLGDEGHPNKRALRAVLLRHGMWVKTPAGVGIVQDIDVLGNVLVMLTDKDGLNLEQVTVPYLAVQQAAWSDVPAARQQITPELARKMGYL